MTGLYRFIRIYWPYVGPIVAIFALGKYLEVTPNDIRANLYATWQWLAAREVRWLAAALLALFFSILEIRNRGVPLTVVSTEVDLLMHTPTCDDATISRRQKIRANHENVTGYWRRIGATGSIPAGSIECTISHSDSWKEFEQTSDGLILMHRFKSPIPRNPFLFWRTVERQESIRLRDAFPKDEEFISQEIPFHYRHRSLTVTVYFHPERQCPVRECRAVRITNAGVSDLQLEYVPPSAGHSAGVRFYVRRARKGDRYKIVWKFPAIAQGQP